MFIKKIDYLNKAQFLQQVEHYTEFRDSVDTCVNIPQLLNYDIDKKTCSFEVVNCETSLLDIFREYMTGSIELLKMEYYLSKISSIIKESLFTGVVHSDLVLHNIFIDGDEVILIDCFPPCDLPNRLNYLTSDVEACGFLFNIVSNSKVLSLQALKKIKPIIPILFAPSILDEFKFITLIKCCYRGSLDYYKIKSKYHPKFKTAVKTILFSIVTFGLLAHEKYFRN